MRDNGGIRSLADLRRHCRVDPDTYCWLWAYGLTHDGQPKAHAIIDGRRITTTGGRVAWLLAHGSIPEKCVVYRTRCSKLCVSPHHMSCGTKAQAGEHLKRSGHLRGHPGRCIINKRNRCSTGIVLNLEKAREIRASDESIGVLAQRYGTSKSTITDVLRMRRWKEPGFSVFSRLAA